MNEGDAFFVLSFSTLWRTESRSAVASEGLEAECSQWLRRSQAFLDKVKSGSRSEEGLGFR